MSLEPGNTLLHYEITGLIGEGGMGSVYRAKDTKLNREVALKVLPADMASDPDRLQRFQREARAVAALNHPHIVTIHNVEEDGDTHFLIMELVEGTSLDRRLTPGGLPLPQVFEIGIALADALAIAHEKGIVHRDLKPANIMLTSDDRVKVLDFGLAKLGGDEAGQPEAEHNPEITSMATAMAPAPGSDSLTQAGTVMGTAPYMSPEQLEGKAVDHRTDIFALGVVLYEISTGRRPFSGGTSAALISSIMRDTPQPVVNLRADVPRPLGRLIEHCLQKKVTDRFQSALDIRNQLRTLSKELESGVSELSGTIPPGAQAGAAQDSYIGGPVTSAIGGAGTSSPHSMPSSPSFVSEVQTALPTRPILRMAMAAVVVLGLAGLAFGLYSLLIGPGTTTPATASFQSMQISILLSRDDLLSATLSGDGRYLAYVTRGDTTTSLVIRQVRTGSDIPILSDSPITIRDIKFSRDGDYLYFLNQDPELPNYSALFQVASLGGTPRKVAFDVDSAPAFSPDGTQFCFQRGLADPDTGSLSITSLVISQESSGEERELARASVKERFVGSPAWSPDGERIAMLMQSNSDGVHGYVATIEVDSGVTTTLGEDTWLAADSVGWAADGGAVLVSAFAPDRGGARQIHRISYPDGQSVRMTNDLDGYSNLSVSTDGATIAAVRRTEINNLWVARPGGSDATAISFASGSSTSMGEIAPMSDGATAFTAPRDNRIFVWRMEADGSAHRQLTTEGLFTMSLNWTQASGIIFTRIDTIDGRVVGHIWRMNTDGSGSTQISHGSGEQIFAVSPAGNALLMQRWEDPRGIWLLRLDGSEPTKIMDQLSGAPMFSPDGQSILTTRMDLDAEGRSFQTQSILPLGGGDELATFRFPPGADNFRWIPDGTAITYIDRDRGFNIMRKNLPDGETVQVTQFESGRIFDHSWHPDGSRLAIHRRVGRNSSLWEIQGESEPTMITEFRTGNIGGLWWAPDEPLLYFRYGTASQDVVLITNFR